jgi:hypothetical protein
MWHRLTSQDRPVVARPRSAPLKNGQGRPPHLLLLPGVFPIPRRILEYEPYAASTHFCIQRRETETL